MTIERTVLCREFEERLAEFAAGQLPGEVRMRVESHLAVCPRCASLRSLVFGPESAPPSPPLVNDVLLQTSGLACGELDYRLSEYLRGTLPPAEDQLVADHLAHCPDCSTIAQVMGELAELLAEQSELDPGPGFVDRVLEFTSEAAEPTSVLDRMLEHLSRAFRSPRFSWEAAYLGALVLFGMFALVGRFVDRPPATLIPTQSALAGSMERRLAPLIQAGAAGINEAERVLDSSTRSAAETGKAFWSAADTRGRQLAGDASRFLAAVQQQVEESASDVSTKVENLWAPE